jgi:enamine deaminase RidA (YjgF/YER057c/UK114 family)
MSQSLKRFHVGDRLSEMAIFQNVVYLAGQVPSDTTQDIAGQTRQVLAMVDRLLAEARTDNAHILMAHIYLADLADYDAMNAVWDDWVPPGDAPPRATVQARLAKPDWKIEIVITAAVSAGA